MDDEARRAQGEQTEKGNRRFDAKPAVQQCDENDRDQKAEDEVGSITSEEQQVGHGGHEQPFMVPIRVLLEWMHRAFGVSLSHRGIATGDNQSAEDYSDDQRKQ